MKNNIILEKTFDFSIDIINLYKNMINNKEYVLSKQLLRSATSIGANMNEAIKSYSKKDFLYRCVIAFREAGETEYWLNLLFRGNFIDETEHIELIEKCNEIIRILNSIIITTKSSLKREKINKQIEYNIRDIEN